MDQIESQGHITMPLVAVNLSDTLFEPIKQLVERGRYASFESFLEVASYNQLALERGASPQEIVERGHREVRAEEAGTPAGSRPMTKAAKPPKKRKGGRAGARHFVKPVARAGPVEPEAISLVDAEAAFERLALVACAGDSPKPARTDYGTLMTQRVFGQVNRLLPLKLACRWLQTTAAADSKWSPYDAISDRLADDATTMGSLLAKWDLESGRKRDELLSTGLPRRGNSASRDRFLSQFVARATRGGDIYPGAICIYQLAKFDDTALVLTEQGLAFSTLENPLLDQRDPKAPATLSLAESLFLIRQILECVPAERDDMQVVLRAIESGKTTPSDLTTAVQKKFPSDWSESVFRTHLSGIVARLGELRLIKRVWQGRFVQYELDRHLAAVLLRPERPA
jgi:hypothetical protein